MLDQARTACPVFDPLLLETAKCAVRICDISSVLHHMKAACHERVETKCLVVV